MWWVGRWNTGGYSPGRFWTCSLQCPLLRFLFPVPECARHFCPLSRSTGLVPHPRMPSILWLGVATPPALDTVTSQPSPRCQYTARTAQLQLSRERSAHPAARSVFVLSATHKIPTDNAASEDERTVWRYGVLLTVIFHQPSTMANNGQPR